MNIRTSQSISYSNNNTVSNKNKETVNKVSVPNLGADTFVSSAKQNKQVSFGGFFSRFLRSEPPLPDENDPTLTYHQRLALGLKQNMETDVPVQCLQGILSGKDLRMILSQLQTQNFISSNRNKESGIYGVDLDYQTSFSFDGEEDIFDVLLDAAQYANYYHDKTGRNFVFAITDKDSVESVQHAIRYIAENPDKFKHLSFVPGVKMSFAHKAPNSNIGYENSYLLIYGINPFSKNITGFIDDTFSRRRKMVSEFIQDVGNLYTEFVYKVSEFADQNGIVFKKDFGKPNMYWRTREYSEAKGDTAIRGTEMSPEDIIADSDAIFWGMDTVYRGSEETQRSRLSSQVIGNDSVNILIRKVFDKFSTHYDEESGQVVSSAENLYGNLVKCMASEAQRPIMAISAPFYFSHHFERPGAKSFDNVVAFIEFLQRKSEGMLIGFESVAPSYDLDKELTQQEVDNFNNYIRQNTHLMEVGGSFASREIEELPTPDE